MFLSSASTAQAQKVYWRLGFGYDEGTNAKTVGGRFPMSQDEAEWRPEVAFPAACRSAPGITSVTGIDDLESFAQIRKIAENVALMNYAVKISCSGQEVKVPLVFELSEDGDAWSVIESPSDLLYNRILERFAPEVLKSFEFENLEAGGVRAMRSSDERVLVMAVRGSKYFVAFDFDEEKKRSHFATKIDSGKYKTHLIDGDERSDWRMAIEMHELDPSDVVGSLRRGMSDAVDLYKAKLDSDIDLAEKALAAKYGDNWLEKMATDVLYDESEDFTAFLPGTWIAVLDEDQQETEIVWQIGGDGRTTANLRRDGRRWVTSSSWSFNNGMLVETGPDWKAKSKLTKIDQDRFLLEIVEHTDTSSIGLIRNYLRRK
ncbi:hypothetical protein [Hyphomonas johnsonii]|uniref:Uncharacterized protein n=1 Tax=Hyphomonas johnsonii MHS-2 TaxID=1280950 RepID=A0A059FTY7_9PROT|nr:hypothetical protein [Hyphomonas johnsonii]KCZ93928.1 hypothetical protein HJO_01095 [Hyphomonas johnsonii MHS-2]